MQGFRKVDTDKWEFAHEGFLRGQKHLLQNIRRRKAPSQLRTSRQALDPCVEVGVFGLDGDIERLRRDKQILVSELVKLRQQQHTMSAYLQTLEERLRRTEMKQQQMMTFMAKAIQNPSFLEQLAKRNDRKKELEEALTRKRRRHIDQRSSQSVEGVFIKSETQQHESSTIALDGDEEFWEEMLNESFEEDLSLLSIQERLEEDVNIFTEQLGYLSSSSE